MSAAVHQQNKGTGSCKAMKIGLIGPTYPYRGGISHYTTLLYEALAQHHDVKFISFSRQYPKILFPGRSDKDPSRSALMTGDVQYLIDSINPITWARTAQVFADYGIEALIIPWWVVFWACCFKTIATLTHRACDAKIVFICHNAVEHESSRWKALITRWVLSGAHRIVTHSTEETETLRQLLGNKSSILTGFHPTYAPLCGPPPVNKVLRPKWGLGSRVLLFFGFVRPYKGLATLLRAMAQILPHRAVHLLVVGEFWDDRNVYDELVSSLGISSNVTFVDEYVPNEELPEYFTVADLVVLPYLSASGSGVAQLAYGFGKPVVAGDVGSLKEVIQNGVNGYLVPPGNPDALAKAIIASLDERSLKSLHEEAARTKDRFSWDALVELVCDSLDSECNSAEDSSQLPSR